MGSLTRRLPTPEADALQRAAANDQMPSIKQPEPKPSPELLEGLRKKGVQLAGMEEMAVGRQHGGLVCPFCDGGQSLDVSFSILFDDPDTALWKCFRGKCGAQGRHSLAGKS